MEITGMFTLTSKIKNERAMDSNCW